MAPTQILNDLLHSIIDALPAGMSDTRADIEKNMRASLDTTYTRFNLVTREEFEVQAAVLARTRAHLKQLEVQIATLEMQLTNTSTKE